jgi:uncharacterized protein YodC (DUF2158 family)
MAGQENNGINVGDVVKLKGGGPKMTVAKIEPGNSSGAENFARCIWLIEERI